jgi:DNA-binding transcriptional ArsR family regulator
MDELDAISALRALGAPTRWKVMRLLMRKRDGMAAGDIAEALQVRQNTLSSHIAALTRCGLVDGHRQGRQIVYAADFENVRRLASHIQQLSHVSDITAAKFPKR